LLDKVYLCENCRGEHSLHLDQTDYIKNHLSAKYNSWLSLKSQTLAQTVQMVEELEHISAKKVKSSFFASKRLTINEYDPVKRLRDELNDFLNRIEIKIYEIKLYCKRVHLDLALEMDRELKAFAL